MIEQQHQPPRRSKRETASRQLAVIFIPLSLIIIIFLRQEQQLLLDLYKPLSDTFTAALDTLSASNATNASYIANRHELLDTSRKWKHIRPISSAHRTKISFRLHDPNTFPITHEYNQYMRCPLRNLMKGKNRNARPTGEVRSGVLPDEFIRNE